MNYRDNWDTWNIVAGACVGAALMYLLDPQGGGRRRALVRDKMIWGSRRTRDGAAAARDLKHRAIGMTAELRSSWTSRSVDDEVLTERVRAELGRLTSHPSSVQVTVSDGHVILAGPVLAAEAKGLLRGLGRVRGVTRVENRMREYESADKVPGLQGGGARPGRRRPWMQDSWSPSARLIATTAGAAMTVGGIWQRNACGLAIAAAGIGLFARGVTDVGPSRVACMVKSSLAKATADEGWRSGEREDTSGRQVSEATGPHASRDAEPQLPSSPAERRSQGDELGGVIH